MTTSVQTNGIISEYLETINLLRGRIIVGMCRFSYWSYQEYIDSFYSKELIESHPLKHEYFSLISGALLIELDSGLVIGFNGDSELNSVIVWIEVNEVGETEDEEDLLRSDPDLLPIQATDKEYSNTFWAHFIGQKISRFQILKEVPKTVMHEDLPNETGLIITVESGQEFLMYHDGSDFRLHRASWIKESIEDETVLILLG